MDTRRGGREQRGAGAQGRAGTQRAVEGDVVMADTDENHKRGVQGPRRRRMVRRSTGVQTGADRAPRQRDAGRVMGTASSVGQNEKPEKTL